MGRSLGGAGARALRRAGKVAAARSGARQLERALRVSKSAAGGLLGGSGWSFVVATVGVNGFNFLFHVSVSRLLGPTHYGALNALLSIVSLMAVPLGAVQLAVTQAVVDCGRSPLRRLVAKSAAYGVLAAAGLWACSPIIDGYLKLASPVYLMLLGLWVPLSVVAAVLQGALMADLRFLSVSLANFVGGGLLRLVAGVALVEAGFGLGGAIAATVVAQAVTAGVLLVVARRQVFTRAPGTVRISVRDAALSIAALAGYTALRGVDVLFARHFLAVGAAGQYAAGATAGRIAFFLPGALVMVAFPRLAADGGSGPLSRRVLRDTALLVTLLGLGTTVVFALWPGWIVRSLFGPRYLPAAGVVPLLALASSALGLVGLATYLQIARRSVNALWSWAGVIALWLVVRQVHSGATSVAMALLIATAGVLVVLAVPAASGVLRSLAGEQALRRPALELPTPELDLSLVVPFYNPGSRLEGHVREVVSVLGASGLRYEVIAVSDGSTDGSAAAVGAIAGVRLLELERNQGKGAALRAGLRHGRGRYLGFIDGDGDIPAAQLKPFMAAVLAGRPDVVLGNKLDPASDVLYPPFRRLCSFGYRQLTRVLFGLPVRDTQTGVKLIRREVLASVLPRMVEKRFGFDLELLVAARRLGYRRFVELPVEIGQRFTTTISPRAVWRLLLDTAAIFYRLRFLQHYGPRRSLGDMPRTREALVPGDVGLAWHESVVGPAPGAGVPALAEAGEELSSLLLPELSD